jgi:hypothetical protein
MPKIERTVLKSKRGGGMPASIKFAIFIAVILGLWGRSCWRSNRVENITFENIVIENPTSISIELIYEVNNNTLQKGKTPILIQVITNNNEEIASVLYNIDIVPQQRSRHIRVIDSFKRPLREGEYVDRVEIGLYHRRAMIGR